ncbi:MAG: flagellin [Terriglobia bacterium]|jgi:flagellin
MALSVLNNIPSLVAQNQLQVTNNNLQNTLFQLSSGSRINSGADDPAGLSIINGLQANISALTQSSQNATDGVGQLQVADGALSQVTTLLNRAVTLATEAANGGLTSDQFAAITNEYASITSEINRIGQATNFNGTGVFQAAEVANPNEVVSTASAGVSPYATLSASAPTTVQVGNSSYTFADTGTNTDANQVSIGTTAMTANTVIAGQLVITSDGGTNTYTTNVSDTTIGALINDINTTAASVTAGYQAFLNGSGQLQIVDTQGNNDIAVAQGAAGITGLTGVASDDGAAVGANATGNTVQDLINGINGAGLGVSAGLATNTNKNQLSFGTAAVGAATALSGTMTITAGANTFTYNSNNNNPVTGGAAEDTVQGLIDSINASGDGLNAYLDGSTGALQIVDTNANNDIAAHSTGTLAGVLGTNSNPDVQQLTITDNQNRGDLTVTNTDSAMGFVANPTAPDTGGNADSFVAPSMSGSGGANVFISDGDVTNPLYNTIKIAVGPLSSINIGGTATTLQSQDLGTASGAASALTVINSAISDVAAMRGTIGAGINRLNSATNVINTQVQNLTSAQSSMQDANIGQVVANMSKYQVLEQTGISALAQANQNEQAVLKLLQ